MPAPQIMRPVICCRWRRQRQQTHPQSCKCRVCSDPWEERQPGPLCHKLPDHMQWACRRAFLAPTRTHQPTALWLVLPPPQIKDELWSFNAQCCLCRSTRSANSTGHNRQRLRRKPQEKAVRQQEQDTERTQCFVSRAVHHYLFHQLPNPTQTPTTQRPQTRTSHLRIHILGRCTNFPFLATLFCARASSGLAKTWIGARTKRQPVLTYPK